MFYAHHSISQEFPQFWHRHILALLIFVFSVPLLFFQKRLDIPKVHIAVTPLAALFI